MEIYRKFKRNMTISVVLLIFLLSTSHGTSDERESVPTVKDESKTKGGNHELLTTLESNFTNSCNQSDTCHGIDQVHLSIQDLQNRNCMCDEQCILYEDCCADSKFKMNSSSQNKFACISTASNGFVYMLASCPVSWNQSRDIQENCLNINNSLRTLDIWILTPVIAQSGITYKNMFCAFCHGESKFNFWKIDVSCAPINSDKSVSENLLDPNEVLNQMNSTGTYPVFWQSPTENTTYHCSWQIKSKDTRLRYCVPRPDICTPPTNCSNTYYVHIDSESTNHKGNTLNRSSGCHPKFSHMETPFAANILNPHVIEVPPCQQIPQEAAMFHRICGRSEKKSETGYSCYPKKPCLIHDVFVINETIIFLDNDTVYLKNRGISYPSSEWLALNETLIYVCGRYISNSTYQQIFDVLDDWISEILIKISIVCLLLHLFIFQQLPQMRNFSGKNLAIFCITLLVAYLCWEIGPKLAHCEISAVILHFALLSCFTWSLLMSYDCWHALSLATKEFRSAGGKHTRRLCIYCILSWLIPGLIISGALYFELSPPEVISCKKKLGYGKYQQCFIGQIYGLVMFFIFPASCMFLGDICFFILTSVLLYGNQKSSVNPNSKIDFLMYVRLALMMGLTWTTGTVFYLTEFLPIGLMFSILNMSQGILIFFAFTLKQSTLKLLLEKHRGNLRVAHVLQILIRDPVSQTPTQMASVENSTNQSFA